MAASFIPGINPIAIGASTMGIGGLILGLSSLSGVKRVFTSPRTISLVLWGALGLAAYSTLFYVGMAWAGVALGNVLALGSAPLFAGLIEWIVDKERPSKQWLIATAITIIGGVMLINGRSYTGDKMAKTPQLIIWGIVFALIAGLAYAAYTYMANKLMKPHEARPHGLGHREVISTLQLVSAIPLLVILAFTGADALANPQALMIMAYLAIFPTAVGHFLLAIGLGTMPASKAAVYTLFEPVVAVVLAVLVVGEVISPFGWVGLGIVLVGLFVLTWQSPKATPVEF